MEAAVMAALDGGGFSRFMAVGAAEVAGVVLGTGRWGGGWGRGYGYGGWGRGYGWAAATVTVAGAAAMAGVSSLVGYGYGLVMASATAWVTKKRLWLWRLWLWRLRLRGGYGSYYPSYYYTNSCYPRRITRRTIRAASPARRLARLPC